MLRRYLMSSLVLVIANLMLLNCAGSPADIVPENGDNASVAIDMLGLSYEVAIDSAGKVIRDAELISADGKLTLSIHKGTRFSFGGKDTAQFIQVASVKEPPASPENARIIGSVYKLLPEAVTADPPILLTINYDSAQLPPDVRESDIYIAPYSPFDGWETWSFKRVDIENHRVTTKVGRFSTFAAAIQMEQVSAPVPQKPDLTAVALIHALSNGKPAFAEFGSSSCIPCKEMKPILENLAVEFEGRLNVVVVDVYDEAELSSKYGIMAMPTQILFDSLGREVSRHAGVFPRSEILVQLKKVGIE